MPTTTTPESTGPEVINIQARINEQDNPTESTVETVDQSAEVQQDLSADKSVSARIVEFRARVRESFDEKSFTLPDFDESITRLKEGFSSVFAAAKTKVKGVADTVKEKSEPKREQINRARQKFELPEDRFNRITEAESIDDKDKLVLAETLRTLDKFESDHPGMSPDYYKQQFNRLFTEIVKERCGRDKKPKKGDEIYDKFTNARKNLIIAATYIRTGEMDAAQLLLGEELDAPEWAEAPKRSLGEEYMYRKVQIKSAWNELRSRGLKETWKEDLSKKQKAVAVVAIAAAGVVVGYASYKGVEFITDAASGSADAGGLAEGGTEVNGMSDGTAIDKAIDQNMPTAAEGFNGDALQAELDGTGGSTDAVASESQKAVDIIAEGENSITEIVARGEGLTDQLIDIANHLDVDLSPSESYELYQYLRAEGLFDGMLAEGTLYEMPNGDLGIQNAGNLQLDRDLLEGIDTWLQRRG